MTTSGDFVHLHVHTEFSMLDGASRIDELMQHVAQDNQPAVAITDHGVLFGLVEFYRRAKEHGVKPILGSELYQAVGSRRDQQTGGQDGRQRYYHLTTLAMNDTGYQNLMALATRAYLEGYWYKPRIDHELLAEHNEGIIVLSGCLGSEVNQYLMAGKRDAARQVMSNFKDIFTPERYFIELMDHGIPEQRRIWPELESLAKELGLRTVITNDSHYTKASDAEAHDALLCIQTGSKINEPNRFRFDGDQYFVKSAAEMRSTFKDAPDALDTTLLIAEMCDVNIEFDRNLLPAFPTPDGVDQMTFLRDEVALGAAKLYGTPLPSHVEERMAYELDVISHMGFAAYFLIVADLCRYARENGIRVGPGRGSAGGSVVAYCLGITRVDPIAHGLIFERFLNPDRIQMPDIDIDFDDRRRGEMIRYAADRYGSDHVAQIVTFSTIKAKSAIRDAARVLDEPFKIGDDLTKMMPPAVQGRDAPLAEAYEKSQELRAARQDPNYIRVLETAEKLEGLKRQHGIHAAAVVIGSRPLHEIVPLLRTENGEIVTQYEMGAAEAIGLLKMDFLGLRNLTVIADAERHVLANRGVTVDLDDPIMLGQMDDPDTYAMLSTGNTLGVFQLDSSGMQALVRKLQPTRFEDISALLALYRPGPLGMDMHIAFANRKNGFENVHYDHPDLEPILGETYGVIVYQEQVMKIATDICGFTMAEADALRKAVGKKIRALMEAQKDQFISGGVAKGYDKQFISTTWELIERFAEYGFNKAHTVAYGVISYQTAWLKTHYPVEYMAALLTSVKANKDTKPLYLAECRRMGIPVLPPDVNTSKVDFTPAGEDIRFGMSAVRGVGEGLVQEIVDAREENGQFTDFVDFCRKVPASVLNKRAIGNLIQAGAFTGVGHSRRGLNAVYEQIIDAELQRKKAESAGQFSLFDGVQDAGDDTIDPEVVIAPDEYAKDEILKLEREMLGLYVSDHPLLGIEPILAEFTDATCNELRERADGANVTVAGVLTGLQKKFTQKGDTYLVAVLEDLLGQVDVVFWPSTYKVAHEVLREDAVLVLTGRLELRDEAVKLTVNRVVEPDLSEALGAPIVVRFQEVQCTPDAVQQLKGVLGNHTGAAPVDLELLDAEGSPSRRFRLGDAYRVARRPGLFGELKATFGPDVVHDDAGVREFVGETDNPPWRRTG